MPSEHSLPKSGKDYLEFPSSTTATNKQPSLHYQPAVQVELISIRNPFTASYVQLASSEHPLLKVNNDIFAFKVSLMDEDLTQ